MTDTPPSDSQAVAAPPVTTETLRLSAQQILADIPFFTRMAPDDKSRQLLLDVIGSMPLPAPIAAQLTSARDKQPELYLHLVRTSLTAAWLAKTPLLSRYDVQMAAVAGMLHDIGMLHVDPLLLESDKVASVEQRRQLYSHPLISIGLIEPHHQYPKEVVRAVREHHECLDGSGYPRNLMGDAISPLGKILSLAKVVAAMFASGKVAPELRLSVLLRMNTHRYDNSMSLQVIGLLQPEADVTLVGLTLLDDPVKRLLAIDDALKHWPAGLAANGQNNQVTPARRDEIRRLGGHVAQIHRALANVGGAPEQLELLGNEVLGDALQREMTLLTREAGWQLRTLARQTRRRWNAGPGENFPDSLQTWLDNVDTVVARITGSEIADEPAAE
jgi:HD domain